MIIGPCPYEGCEGTHFSSIAPHCPSFSKERCEVCGREYWLKHSRWDPAAYTLEDFAKKYVVNEANMSIKERT